MPPSSALRRWMLIFLVLAAIASPIRSQFVTSGEVSAHLRPAIDEVLRARRLDRPPTERAREAHEALYKAFRLSDEQKSVHLLATSFDKEAARDRVAKLIREGQFGLTHDDEGFKLLEKPPEDFQPELVLRTSSQFVDSVFAVIRRLSILDEIGPAKSEDLQRDQLRDYLKFLFLWKGIVPDYDQVAASFAPSLTVNVVTFDKATTLLRLYGGASHPMGRYYFCCLLRGTLELGFSTSWLDASGLATPPGNLKEHLAVVTIPAGTTAIVGTVADNFLDRFGHAERGGNTQIFIPEVKNFPFQEYRLAGNLSASEIAVVSDDRILRFRSGPRARPFAF